MASKKAKISRIEYRLGQLEKEYEEGKNPAKEKELEMEYYILKQELKQLKRGGIKK